MNQIQEAIARVTGVSDIVEQLHGQLESIGEQNVLLQHQIEDLDYLNLYDLQGIKEIVPLGDRKTYINRMRRLRQENPIAKQGVKLILRFTLGRGVQISIGPDPEKELQKAAAAKLPTPPVDPTKPPHPVNTGLPFTSVAKQASTGGGSSVFALPNEPTEPTSGIAGDEADPLAEIVNSFWLDDENKIALTSNEAMRDWLDGNVTDGEKFIICFEGDAAPYVKLTEIPVDEIQMIIYHPSNRLMPVYYRRVWQELIFEDNQYRPDGDPKTTYYLDHRVNEEQLAEVSKKIKIKPSELAPKEQRIFHSMVNPLWTRTGRRGVSELFASREYFRVYKEFIENRAAINEAATSIAFKRKIKAGPTGVASFAGKFGGLDVGYDNPDNNSQIRKLTKPTPGAVYDSNPAVDIDWMKTDTGAVNAEKDGQAILMSAGSGIGIFAQYFGEGGDANLATAQAMELPMVKTFEDWQEWVNTCLTAMLYYVIRIATDEENAKKQINRVSGTFPPLISQDVVKYTTAWSQVVQNVAPGNKIVHREAIKGALTVMNVPNVDSLMSQIEAEEAQLEVQRQQQHAAMINAMNNPAPPVANGNGNGNGNLHARDGNTNALPPDLATVAKGKPAPARNGPKPA